LTSIESPRVGAVRWPLRVATGLISALSVYILLSAGGRTQGLLLIALAVAATVVVLWLSERRSRVQTHAVHLARQRIRGLSAAHEQAVRNEQRFRTLVLNASETISILGADHTIQYSSPSVERLWGYSTAQLLNADFYSLIHPQDAPMVRDFLAELSEAPGAHRGIEFRLLHRDGEWRYLEAVATNLLDNSDIAGIVFNSRDTTERKELEQKLTHQAFHDPLTALPNRALFMDRLEHALAGSKRIDGQVAGVAVDVDHCKGINDTRGHAVGDEILIAVSRALVAGTRARDTVARLGGDEFAMLLEGVHDEREAITIGERLIGAFDTPIRVRDHDVEVSLSIGIGLEGGAHRTSSELLRAADLALYQAKRDGRGRCVAFDDRLDSLWIERVEIENAMRGAVGRGEFANFYQPIVDLHSGDIVGMEALVRWHHPQRGLVGPNVFVPLAEETGEISAIGRWVLEEACREARGWQIFRHAGVVISVNVSARQLQQQEFVGEVAAALHASGLDPSLLQLEITESLLVEHGQVTLQRLDELKRLGVRLAIDDFGTGYSSLSYLTHLPVDALKLDRSFVSPLGRDERADSIVRAIMMLAHGLLIDVVAEGIETEEQQDLLRRFGYSRGQGYLYARPMPADEAIEAVRAGNVLVQHAQPAGAAA
jgi:diguanylate cyclase (GGDEF)-like protein/PAS domain S-box-containing protein